MDTNKKKKIKNLTLIIGGSVLMVMGLTLIIASLCLAFNQIINHLENSGKYLPYFSTMLFSGTIMFTSSFFVLSKRKI